MKLINISIIPFLLFTSFSYAQSDTLKSKAQSDTIIIMNADTIKALKAIVVKKLNETDIYLTKASQSLYQKADYHDRAATSYKVFEKAYNQLKSNLSNEINNQIAGVVNVYSQLVTDNGMWYITDSSTVTALAICSVKVEKITKELSK